MGVEWRIYYADGTRFDNTQGEVWDAPNLGVVCIVYYKYSKEFAEDQRIILNKWDWYMYRTDDKTWYGCDSLSVPHYWREYALHIAACFTGETITTDRFSHIMQSATNDTDFPKKKRQHDWGQNRRG